MEMLGITAVAAITVICYLAAAAAKALGLPGKWLPVLCGLCGGVLGMAAMYLEASLFFSFRDRGRAVRGSSLTGVRSLITLFSFRSSLPIWSSFLGFGVRSSTSVQGKA